MQKGEGQNLLGSKVKVETVRRTDGRRRLRYLRADALGKIDNGQ